MCLPFLMIVLISFFPLNMYGFPCWSSEDWIENFDGLPVFGAGEYDGKPDLGVAGTG
jgi:hypothetical protein